MQRIGGAESAQIAHQRREIAIAGDEAIAIDDGQRKASALHQAAERTHVGKWRDARRGAAGDLALGDRQALAQLT